MTQDPHDEAQPTVQPDAAEAQVAAMISRLDRLDDLPVDDHIEHYERIHGDLQDLLSHADEA